MVVCSLCDRGAEAQVFIDDVVPACNHCAATYSAVKSGEILAQCCECGVFLNGARKGRVARNSHGVPYIHLAPSHGMCQDCHDRKLAAWLAQKALRLIEEHGNIANVSRVAV